MGSNSTDEDGRCHPQRDAAAWRMDLLDDQVIATFDALSHPMVEQPDHKAAQRQEEQQPRMRETGARRDIEAPQEGGAERADGDRHRHEHHRPAGN